MSAAGDGASPPALARLAERCGITPEYVDVAGERHVTSPETARALLAAMGFEVASESDAERALDELDAREWGRRLAPVMVVREGAGCTVSVALPSDALDQPLAWRLVLEDGSETQGRASFTELDRIEERDAGNARFTRFALPVDAALPLGYHRFELDSAAGFAAESMSLIVAPLRCHAPAVLAGDRRLWGLAIQLYALRSTRNWGIGDLSDLRTAVGLAARDGASLVGTNPLHALFPHNPLHASPYSPSSRQFGNVWLLDVEAVDGFDDCEEAKSLVADGAFQARLRALRAERLVDYAGTAELKRTVLEALYRCFRERHIAHDTSLARAFRAFQAERGEPLRRHCVFEALQAARHGEDAKEWGWPVWPEALRDPHAAEIERFASSNAERVEFYEYLQWQFERQLGSANTHARSLGLGIGLYADLAVGIDGGGSEAWANQDVYARGARVGAPPDLYNPNGQDWGLLPPIPMRLQESGYALWIDALRANMRHAGALRIDHVMALLRLFWVLPGTQPMAGAYVRYPFDDLLGILALESHRNRCLVIGEDLGTVPDEARDKLGPAGVLSYRVFYFETRPDGSFKAPSEYPRDALVCASTHDLPTLKGYWRGYDLALRRDLGLFPSDRERETQILARAQDRARMLLALDREGLLPPGASIDPMSVPEMTDELALAVQRYLARTPSQLLMVQMEDVLGQIEQINLPGTVDQHPNWRRKLSVTLEAWAEEPRVRALAKVLQAERPAPELKPASAPADQGGPRAAASATHDKPRPSVIPRATYRLQLNHSFTFDDASDVIPYLAALGVSHCYASPYLRARPGSLHGYDIIDHNALNPEIGSAADFERFVASLHAHGLRQVLDVVPNHMGVLGSDNAWWLDVLENGQASVFAEYFDIDWFPLNDALEGKVLIPVLGEPYGTVLERGEIQLRFDAERGEFSLFYFANRFPVGPRQYPRILAYRIERLEARIGADHPDALDLESLITALGHLPARVETASDKIVERKRDKESHKRRLAELVARSPDVAWFVNENVAALNGAPGDPASFDRLHELIGAQAYRLAYWRVAADDINYRRFFDVNELAGLRMENEAVFDATHRLIFDWLAAGKIDALRIDHPDGLYDPLQYFERVQRRYIERLQKIAGYDGAAAPCDPAKPQAPLYLLVEKIVANFEKLPAGWPVHGTTGYDFANLLNGLFIDSSAEPRFTRTYTAFIGERLDFERLLYDSKRLIMQVSLASELNVLAFELARIAQASRHTCDFTLNSLRNALREVVACFPVYRTYVTSAGLTDADRRYIDWAVSAAQKAAPASEPEAFEFIRSVMLMRIAEGRNEAGIAYRDRVARFATRVQQFTSPVTAKGMEDTAFYRYNRLVSTNEVGGDPRVFGISIDAFHAANRERVRAWPHTMLATSTHDSKRSEDVRARLNVLSELPAEWRMHLNRWRRSNRRKTRLLDGAEAPSRNDEYLLYQTLVGAWPFGELEGAALDEFRGRIEAYMQKVVREAKLHTSWVHPNADYESGVADFVGALLDPRRGRRFLDDFVPFQRRIAWFGMWNSLSQLVLKLTAPGVPDIYQGNELWNFSLVDPDNRRPVDYALRKRLLDELAGRLDQASAVDIGEKMRALADELLQTPEDGRIKLFVTWRALRFRAAHESLFRDGDYIPLQVSGAKADHLCAFARMQGGALAITLVPRLAWKLANGEPRLPLGRELWGDTSVLVPVPALRLVNVFSAERLEGTPADAGTWFEAATVFEHFPVALLEPC